MNCAIQKAGCRTFALLLFFFSTQISLAQEIDTTAGALAAVEVKAFGQTRKLKDIPAAVGFVSSQALNRFGSANVVQAVNTIPGVRMEERSPGSYRFNIRGSALRSPFGVRNVKVYYNELPFTDPGGQTYLNALGYYNIGSLEVLKGPGSSLYGAGTGGVLLIEGMSAGESIGALGEFTVGSYGLHNAYASLTTGDAERKSKIGFQHQSSEGYRRQSNLKRDIASWTGQYRFSEKQQLKTTFLYSHLFYGTPGGLTRAEYEKDPRMARPSSGTFPSAETARASVNQNTFLVGASYTQQVSSAISNQSILYGAFTEMRNPAIRNYGRAMEPHVGGRTSFDFKKQFSGSVLTITLGGELQQNFSTSTVFKNVAGNADSLQSEDEIHIRQGFAFAQANLQTKGWEFTAGGSLNYSKLRFRRVAPAPLPEQQKKLNDQFTPRFAVAKKFSAVTVYTSVSKGFSPPTTGELLPSGSAINLGLQAEEGTNYDLGLRGLLWKNLSFDVNAFYFRVKNTIIQRRDAGGGDFYVNAGTAQQGVETSLNYAFLQNNAAFRRGNLWVSHAYEHFRYRDFVQVTQELSGRAVPGVAPNTISSGIDLVWQNGLSANLTYYYSSKLPLNDLNTAYTDAYHLLGARIGFERLLGSKGKLRLAIGGENLLDQRYSLGNDINAAGGRYFNAAAGRNYYVSLLVQLFSNNEKAPR